MKKTILSLLLLAMATQLSAQHYYYVERAPYLGDTRFSLVGGLDFSSLGATTLTIVTNPGSYYSEYTEETFEATSASMAIAPTIGLSYNGIERKNILGQGFNVELNYSSAVANASFAGTTSGDYEVTTRFERINFLMGYSLAYFFSDDFDLYLGLSGEARNARKGTYTLTGSKMETLEGETHFSSFLKQFTVSVVCDLGAHYYIGDHLAVGAALRYARMFNPDFTLCNIGSKHIDISTSFAPNRFNVIAFATYIL